MRILLISPPFYRILGFYNRYYPLGITIIGTVLKQAGHEVKVYDADCYVNPRSLDYSQLPSKYPLYLKSFKDKDHVVWNELRQVVKEFKPDLVGLSAFTTFATSAFFVAKEVKKMFPRTKVVMGGPHATVKSDEILKICPEIDYVVSGEGEEAIKELVEYLEKKRIPIESILGLSYREGKKIRHNSWRPLTKDIDKFPIPDRSILVNEKKYSSEDMGLIMTSRGCPYNCTYCASTKGLSYRSVDSVIKEILLVKKKYGTTQFTFKDDSFTVDKSRVKDLCRKIRKMKLSIKWECNTRVNLIDKELLVTMKRAGCNFIKVGIESGSERVLKTMNKGITLDQGRKAAKLLRESGIHWTGYFMMGVISETEDDIYQTLKFMEELKPNLALIGVYEPFPGTVMFKEGIKKGLVKENMSLKDFYTVLPNNYYKMDPKIQSDVINPQRFTMLESMVKKTFHNYNMKWENIWTMASSKIGVYLREPKVLFEDAEKFYKYTFSKK